MKPKTKTCGPLVVFFILTHNVGGGKPAALPRVVRGSSLLFSSLTGRVRLAELRGRQRIMHTRRLR